jgi:hypothetical protein
MAKYSPIFELFPPDLHGIHGVSGKARSFTDCLPPGLGGYFEMR